MFPPEVNADIAVVTGHLRRRAACGSACCWLSPAASFA
jgi:hypothetical protein